MPLYFAYGSNMDVAAMAQRCPASKVIGTARLMRHRFFISTDGYASVMRDPSRTVWGLRWDLALADVRALDRYEDLASGLYSKIEQPVVSERGARRAIIYIGRSVKPGTPKPGYMEGVMAAAREVGLPEDYLRSLEPWLPKTPSSAPAKQEQPRIRPLWSAPSSSVGKPKGS
ncbi:gamma-glutamylcyclotransferase family protein [Microvirga flavescens]|uniref:gamma-glutamylcyclotransferase family protein n=1 Tax=Microvirga flavescens TaxID=2249811 RepID=UPI000DD83A63